MTRFSVADRTIIGTYLAHVAGIVLGLNLDEADRQPATIACAALALVVAATVMTRWRAASALRDASLERLAGNHEEDGEERGGEAGGG